MKLFEFRDILRIPDETMTSLWWFQLLNYCLEKSLPTRQLICFCI